MAGQRKGGGEAPLALSRQRRGSSGWVENSPLTGTPDMARFEIEIVEERGFLRFTFRGPSTHRNLLRAIALLIEKTQSSGIWHVLCDVTPATTLMGAFEKFEAGVELARGADPRLKMAVVARVEDIDYLFESVSRNRGVSVAVFRSEGAALQWLLGTKIRS